MPEKGQSASFSIKDMIGDAMNDHGRETILLICGDAAAALTTTLYDAYFWTEAPAQKYRSTIK